MSNSGNPIINEFTEFIITSHAGSQLVFKVYDDDTWPNSDDFLGTASLNLGKVISASSNGYRENLEESDTVIIW